MSGTRFGPQPAREFVHGRLGAAAAHLSVTPGALAAYLEGRNVAPAEIKLGLAEHLDLDVERCWTPEALAETYRGPRRAALHRPQ